MIVSMYKTSTGIVGNCVCSRRRHNEKVLNTTFRAGTINPSMCICILWKKLNVFFILSHKCIASVQAMLPLIMWGFWNMKVPFCYFCWKTVWLATATRSFEICKAWATNKWKKQRLISDVCVYLCHHLWSRDVTSSPARCVVQSQFVRKCQLGRLRRGLD